MAQINVSSDFSRFEAADVLAAMTEEVKGELARAIGTSIYNRWVYFASQLEGKAKATYLQSIQQVTLNGSTAVVVLAGAEANALENGKPAGDLRTTLLGPNVPIVAPRQGLKGKHQSKSGGYYRAIPFRHSSPSSQGSTGAPMGKAYTEAWGADRAKQLGKAIYAAARRLNGSTTQPFRVAGNNAAQLASKTPGTKWGGRLSAHHGGIPLLRAHHTVDIYAGMVKLQKTYEKATQSVYMTFRTISTNKTVGWYTHPTEGLGLMAKVSEELPQMGRNVLEAFANSLSSKVTSETTS